jgi:hypothetical protein
MKTKLPFWKRILIPFFLLASFIALVLIAVGGLFILVVIGKKIDMDAVVDHIAFLEHKWFPGLEILFHPVLYKQLHKKSF